MKFKVLPTGVGYAGRQACRRSAIIKYFFHCMFRKDGGQKMAFTLSTVGKRSVSRSLRASKTGNQGIAHFRFGKQLERR